MSRSRGYRERLLEGDPRERGETREAEVEVKVERTPEILHLSLGLSLNLPIVPADCFSTLLEDRTALSLRCKPFSLQLLNKGRAVHIEQLSRLARNPIGLSKRTNDETVLQLLELS